MIRKVKYGSTEINYQLVIREELKRHYLSVDCENGVILKGRELNDDEADKLVLQKARWVLEKLQIVQPRVSREIVTGSRLSYLGRKYYTKVVFIENLESVRVSFNYSKFLIKVPLQETHVQESIQKALDQFFLQKAVKKITPKVNKWSAMTGLVFNDLRFQKMEKRWGSCTSKNNIILNSESVKLKAELIDYIIVHELCHLKIRNHSKAFWAEVSKWLPNHEALDKALDYSEF